MHSFFCQVDIRLVEENMRARKFLHPTSYDKVVRVCQGKLVEDHLSLLQGECKQMVKEEKLAGKVSRIDNCNMATHPALLSRNLALSYPMDSAATYSRFP